MLAGQFCHRVGRNRIGRHALQLGQGGRIAVSRRRSRINHTAHPGGAGRHQQVERRVHAAHVGGHRIGHGTGHRGQRRLVKHNFSARAGPCAHLRIGQVALDELHCLKAEQVFQFSGNKVVHAAHGLAARQKSRCNRAADESGGSGNQVFSQCSAPLLSNSRSEKIVQE